MSPETNQNAHDESAREEPGYGDEKLSSGPIVDEQLEALGAFGGNPADRKGEESPVEEVFKAAEANGSPEEEEKEEAEGTETEKERDEEVEKLAKTPEPESKAESDSEKEEEEEEEEEGEEEAVEEELSDEEISEIEELKAQNAKLIELVNSQLLSTEDEEESVQEPAQEQKVSPERLPLPIPKLPELTQENLDEVVSNPESFNKYMKAVFDAGQQSLFSMLPRIVSSQMETRDVMTNFFKENQDIAPMHIFVKQLAIKVQNQDPSATPATALEKAGKQARSMLGLERGKQREVKQGNKKPRRRFAPATSKRKGPTESSRVKERVKKEDPDSVQSQIAEMEKVGRMI